ncbi:MAG: N-formylglutamate amidohydrolase, partial [Sphingobacterium sp.]
YMGNLFEFRVNKTDSPYWAFAIHDSHQIDERLIPYLQLNEQIRFREEDPHTGCMAELPMNQLLVSTSRFQLDINRKIEDAIYLHPDQAWGLTVWKDLPEEMIRALQSVHTDTYMQIDALIEETICKYGFFMIWDLHSYNSKRASPDEVLNTAENPQINLGTFYNHPEWRHVIDQFIQSVSTQKFRDMPIDIRENVKFKGGYLAQHILAKYGDKGCVLSIEFRKDFMDEWTGVPYMPLIQSYKRLLLHVLTDFKTDPIYAAG